MASTSEKTPPFLEEHSPRRTTATKMPRMTKSDLFFIGFLNQSNRLKKDVMTGYSYTLSGNVFVLHMDFCLFGLYSTKPPLCI